MHRPRTALALALASVLLTPAAHAAHHEESAKSASASALAAALPAVLADSRRAEDKARDAFRHPAETLAFFKVEPNMTVVDVIPGGGWYTRILAPLLAEKGRYIAINPDVGTASEQARKYFGNLGETFPAKAAGWTGQPAERIAAYNTDGLPETLDGMVDRVLIFREMHNLLRMGPAHKELTTYRRLLKPDGMLGIVQHRAKADAPADYTNGSKGYLREKDVIALMDLYGFELVARSDINANPKDTADHPEGVWELPPSLGTKRDELKTIGESDRMTLLFRKRQ